MAQTYSLDINISAVFGSGFSVGYADDYYGRGSWYFGSNVHFGDPGFGLEINTTQYRYTGNSDWDFSTLQGKANYWQAGAGLNKIIHGGYTRTWNKEYGITGDGIYFGTGLSVSPANGAIGISLVNLLRINK